MLALFDLNERGDVIERLPCGHRLDNGDGEAHETVCLGGVCPFCGEAAGGYDVWLHHNPRGYREAGYCAQQRHAFDMGFSCVECHHWAGMHLVGCSLAPKPTDREEAGS